MRRAAAGAAAVLGAAMTACASSPPSPAHREPTPAEWAEVRRDLERARAAVPSLPYAANVHVTMYEPRSGRTFDARGAVAVLPREAVRMILVGPGGATALDAWVTREAWRLSIPGLNLTRRGLDPQEEGARGLPVGFFRWWFLGPLDGTLLTARLEPSARTFVLRDGAATAEVRVAKDPGAPLQAQRRAHGQTERVEWFGTFAPKAGDHGRYVHEASGLRVEVVVEGVAEAAPDPDAFRDPDEVNP